MLEQSSQLVRLGVGGLGGSLGIAGYKSWIIAIVILLVLVALARWTMRPARRSVSRILCKAADLFTLRVGFYRWGLMRSG